MGSDESLPWSRAGAAPLALTEGLRYRAHGAISGGPAWWLVVFPRADCTLPDALWGADDPRLDALRLEGAAGSVGLCAGLCGLVRGCARFVRAQGARG